MFPPRFPSHIPSVSFPLISHAARRLSLSVPDLGRVCSRCTLAALLLTALALLAFSFAPASLQGAAAAALLVTALAIIGWTLTPISDSVVAIIAALALVVMGVFPEEDFYAALGSELTWLLIAAFVIAAVVKTSGLMERLAFSAVRPFTSLVAFFHALTLVISTTAFLIPSTSGRAALLLPVFLALVDRMPGPGARRALALLFPTVILLSAGGSLIGAGAHFVAVEAIRRTAGVEISYFGWMAAALPIALLSAHLAAQLILALFVPAEEREGGVRRDTHTEEPRGPLSRLEKRVVAALLLLIAAWSTTGLHGIGISVIACAGATLLLTPLFTQEKPKTLFRHVETELLVFLAATVVIADAMVSSGASTWLAGQAMGLLPEGAVSSRTVIVVFAALIAVLAHLVIQSRSARAAVLIPAIALPLAAFGHDVPTLVLVTVLGTGFCQTMMTSAKPVAIFGRTTTGGVAAGVGVEKDGAEETAFTQSDLFRLAVPLLPIKLTIIIIFALFIWPVTVAPMFERSAALNATQIEESAEQAALAADPASASPHESPAQPAAEPIMEGALCTRPELERVMLALIEERRMWAAGWWHIWDRLRRDGYRLEQDPVRTLYRGEDMVRLRSHSTRFGQPDMTPDQVAAARTACGG